jgi:hypothetical protein
MSRKALLVGVIGSLAAALFAVRLLAEFDWNPSTTIKFGEVFTEQNEYAEALLGEIVIAPQAGHDGKFFFSQAMDPFYLEPETHAIYLDRPAYRAQRMLYPTLASLGGLLSPVATAWGLVMVNILAMGVGTAYTSLVAQRMGLSTWYGLAFTLNPGIFIVMAIDGSGIVAGAGLMAGVYYTMRRDLVPAVIALSAAALSRETMLIAAAGLAWYLVKKTGRVPWVYSAPFVAVALWWMYVHTKLQEGASQDLQAVGLPFVGFAEAMGRWLSEPDSLVSMGTGILLILVSLSLLIRSIRTPTELGWATAGFALLGLLLSEPVWHEYFDSARALAPVVTAYLLLIPALARGDETADLSRRKAAVG